MYSYDPEHPDNTLLTGPEVADRYHVTKDTVLKWRKAGVMPAPIMLNGVRPRWRLSELHAWEDSQREGGV